MKKQSTPAARLRALAMLLTLSWLGGATEADGQQRVAFDGQGGVSVPTGQLASYTDAGPHFGMQVGYLLSPRVVLGLDGNVDLWSGARLAGEARVPDLRQWRYGVGLAADLLPSERWALVGSLGAGLSRLTSDEFTNGSSSEPQSFGKSYFTSNGGMKLGYALSPRVTTYLGAQAVYTAASETDTEMLASLDPTRLEAFGSVWSVPVSVGFNVKLGGGRSARVASAPAGRPAPAASRPDDSARREAEASRLCEQAEAALASGDYARARALYERARSEYSGTACARAATEGLERVALRETLAERVHFEYDRDHITDEGAAVLQRKADVLRRHPDLQITIEGHCDERGSLEYNQALGMRRARGAMRYLISLGIPETTFDAVTYGKERPLVGESNERAWSLNRRAEFLVRNPDIL